MTVEILYPELCNLYGDRGNMDYLKQCLPAEFRETALGGLAATPFGQKIKEAMQEHG